MKKEILFYIYIPAEFDETGVAGPYDLVQLAALLRRGQITSETLTFVEGEMEWRPFGDRTQFIVAKEMPRDAVSHRVVAIEEAASAGNAIIPLPSKEQLVHLGAVVFLLLIGAGVVYGVARADAFTGCCLFILANSTTLVAQAFIAAKVLDEDWLTLVLLIFVPFYDLYYFASNITTYWPFLAAKYGGILFAFAAYTGMASGSPQQAEHLKSLLEMVGL